MAKRRHKKARHGRRKRRLSAKQRRAIMRNLKKARRALRSKRRGHGKRRKSRKGRKSRRRSRRRGHSRRKHGHRHHAHRRRKGGLMQTLMRRGYSREKAYKIAERLHRMRSSRKRKQAASFFEGLGAVGHAAAAKQAYESGNY